jgi:hypothetical protein
MHTKLALIDADLLHALERIGKRFAGFDAQHRRPAPKEWVQEAGRLDWTNGCEPAACWRIRIIASKNERKDFRILAYGGSFAEAAQLVIDQVGKFT